MGRKTNKQKQSPQIPTTNSKPCLCPLLSKCRDCFFLFVCFRGPSFMYCTVKEKICMFLFWNKMQGAVVCVKLIYVLLGRTFPPLLTNGHWVVSVSICCPAWFGAGLRPVAGELVGLLCAHILLWVTLLAMKLSWILICIYKCERLMAQQFEAYWITYWLPNLWFGIFCIKISQYF